MTIIREEMGFSPFFSCVLASASVGKTRASRSAFSLSYSARLLLGDDELELELVDGPFEVEFDRDTAERVLDGETAGTERRRWMRLWMAWSTVSIASRVVMLAALSTPVVVVAADGSCPFSADSIIFGFGD
jgi:hypothetical protein